MADFLTGFDDHEHPLRSTVAAWCRTIRKGLKFKQEEFQADADDCRVFFSGTKDDFWRSEYAGGKRGYMGKDTQAPQPEFQMILMKIAEAVQLFGPSMYANNPTIEVNALRSPQIPPEALGIMIDPNMPSPEGQMYQYLAQKEDLKFRKNKASAAVLSEILNYGQREMDAKLHSRRAIDDALVTGLGVLWTTLYKPEYSETKIIQSEFDCVDRLVFDPDAECEEEVRWIARKRVMPYWEAEEKFSLEPGTLEEHATHESHLRQEAIEKGSDEDHKRKQGKTSDLIVFWEVYSKLGMGDRLTGVPDSIKGKFDEFGKYTYLAICDCVPWPLNLPSHMLEKWDDDEVFVRCQWPIPFWADCKSNGWPFTPLAFHRLPNKLYPMSHFKPGMGELKWLTWAMSFLANKVRSSCGTIIGVLKAAGEDLKAALKQNVDNKVVELEKITGERIENIVSFLQQPAFHGDIWKVVAAVFDLWDKRVGLSELLYGMQDTQDRSATTTSIKQENASARITDMVANVESWAADVARKEAMAIRWLLEPSDVAGIVGELGAYCFAQNIQSTDIEAVVREFSYTVAAGSTRMQNTTVKMANLNEFMSRFGPVVSQAAMGVGVMAPLNSIIAEWGRLSKTDVESWMIPEPQPQEQQPDPKAVAEAEKVQAESQLAQQETQLKMQVELAKLEMEREKHQMDLQQSQMDLQARMAEMQLKAKEAQQKMAMQVAEATMKMEMQRQQAEVDLATQQAKAKADIGGTIMKSAVGIQTAKAQSDANVQATKAKAAAASKPAKKPTKTPRKGTY